MLLRAPLNNMQLPGWVLTTVAGPTEAHYQEGPFKKEKRVNNIQLPERAPTEAVKIGPSKKKLLLTRAPLGYFYNAPHGGVFRAPSDLRNYWTDSKNSSGI